MKSDHNISPEEMDLIEQFLGNQLAPEEAAAFAKRLETDEVLQEKVKEMKLLLTGVEEVALKKKIETYHSGITREEPAEQKAKPVISLRRRFAIAASVFVVLSLSVWWLITRENKSEKLYSTYYTPDPGLITAMGTGGNYSFEKAMVDYKNKDYSKAIDEWMKLKTTEPQNDTLNYFLGAAYQANDENKAAIEYFEKTASDIRKPFYKDACWYLGLAYLKTGNKEKAREFIQKSGRPRSPELLNALNSK